MPTLQSSTLRIHVTLQASVGIEYSPATGLPETTSDHGAAMVVTYARLTFDQNGGTGEWEFAGGDAEGYYLHTEDGRALITGLHQAAKLTPSQATREPWLADAIERAFALLPLPDGVRHA